VENKRFGRWLQKFFGGVKIFAANRGDYFSRGINCDCEILTILSNLRCKGIWHSGVNNLDIESISVKKAKSQITVTEDVFPENKRFVSEPKEGQSLPYCATHHILDSLLVYLLDYFQHLDLCLVGTNYILNALQQRYKSRTTTELQKYISANGPNYVVLKTKKTFQYKNLPFLLLMTIASSRLHQARFWVGRKKRFNHNFENIALLAKWIVLTRTAS